MTPRACRRARSERAEGRGPVPVTDWRAMWAGIGLGVLLMLAACKPGGGGDGGSAARGGSGGRPAVSQPLFVFAGAASQPATTEVARHFEAETGIRVACTFGGSGTVLNQIRLEHFGDVYIPGSNDYMDLAEAEGHVLPATRRIICHLRPVICVAKGNPMGIRELRDLRRERLKLTIGDPESVCLGAIARDTLQRLGLYESVRGNIVTYASDCQQVVTLIRLHEVDAAIGYDVFQKLAPDDLEAIPIPDVDSVNIPAAVVTYTRQRAAAERFIATIAGPIGQEVFARHGYSLTPD